MASASAGFSQVNEDAFKAEEARVRHMAGSAPARREATTRIFIHLHTLQRLHLLPHTPSESALTFANVAGLRRILLGAIRSQPKWLLPHLQATAQSELAKQLLNIVRLPSDRPAVEHEHLWDLIVAATEAQLKLAL